MFSAVQIINIGLGKLGTSRIERLDPPRSALERFVESGYLQWKRSELTKRRWVFATEDGYVLPKVDDDVTPERPYKFELPVKCLRPIRLKRTEWVQRGRFILSAYDPLKISMIVSVAETDFDPLFVDVLACRVAVECVEFVTQSNTKKAEAQAAYEDAVAEAGRANAYVIGPEDYTGDDDVFPFLTSRY